MTPPTSGQPTRVGVNLLWLVPSDVGGSEEATINAVRALDDDSDGSLEIVIFGTAALRAAYPDLADRFPFEVLDVNSSSRGGRVWAENTELGRVSRVHDLHLMHHGGGTVPLRSELPVTVTIHDIQPLDLPRNFSPIKRYYLAAGLRIAARRAAAIAVPSSFVANGLHERLGTAREGIFVVPWCVSGPTVSPPPATSSGPGGEPYFLYPAVTWNHKNHAVLISAFEKVAARCEVDLVLTGSSGPAHDSVMARIAASPASKRIRHLGRVPREELDELMGGALALVFPSTYEGFGMPVVEAVSMGVPVVASNAGSLPELLGPDCEVLDPFDVAAWSEKMMRVASDVQTRATMSEASRGAARRFAPELTAKGYRDMWRLVQLGST